MNSNDSTCRYNHTQCVAYAYIVIHYFIFDTIFTRADKSPINPLKPTLRYAPGDMQ